MNDPRLTLGNLSIDELVNLGRDSDDPLLAELCRRLSPDCSANSDGQLELHQCKGKTIIDVREAGDRLVLLFEAGKYFVVGAEISCLDGSDAYLTFRAPLTMPEKHRLGLISPSEWDAHLKALKEQERKNREAEIERLEARLAELRAHAE